MDNLYFSVNLEDDHTLFLAPLTDRRIEMSGQEIANPGGYYLYEKRGSGDWATIEIIAQVLSDEAAMRLRDVFKMS